MIIILLTLGAIIGIAMIVIRRAMRRMENGIGSNVLPAAEERAPVPAPAVNQQREPTGSYAKRCPTCRSIYADETLAFCLSDGSTLELVSAAPPPLQQHDPNATALYPGAQGNGISPTVQYQPGLTTDKKE